jgi:citrate lyase subunit beta/citryl-CoA lyase
MGGSAGEEGDLAHELGFRWSASFEESFYVRSKVLVDVRAAGVPNPMTGVVTNLRGLGEVEAFARQSRGLGYAGMMLIHPSHVAVANAAFGASPEELAAARRLVEALERAERTGAGAIVHEGRMVDAAMARVARELLAEAGETAGAEGPAAR